MQMWISDPLELIFSFLVSGLYHVAQWELGSISAGSDSLAGCCRIQVLGSVAEEGKYGSGHLFTQLQGICHSGQ